MKDSVRNFMLPPSRSQRKRVRLMIEISDTERYLDLLAKYPRLIEEIPAICAMHFGRRTQSRETKLVEMRV